MNINFKKRRMKAVYINMKLIFFLSGLKELYIFLCFILFYEKKGFFLFQAASKIDVKMFFCITLEGKASGD